MPQNTPIYIRDIVATNANDNRRILPMKEPRRKSRALRWGLFFVAGILIGKFAVPVFIETVGDRMERQRLATENYNCAYYGAAMNRFYGRDVCEDEVLHKEALKTQ